MKGCTVSITLCLLIGVIIRGTSGAETPQMSCNISTEFALDLVGCVIKPFTDFLNIDPFTKPLQHKGQDFHPFKKYTMGRQAHILNDLKKAKGIQDIFKVVGGFEQTEFDKVRDRLNPRPKGNDEEESLKISMREYVLQQIINNVDFDEVADHLLLQMMGVASALRSQAIPMANMMSGLTPDQHINFPWGLDWNGTRSLVCSVKDLILQPVLRRLCSVMKCLPNFDEASMEDDIKFARCFFDCQDMPIISQCMHDAFDGCQVKLLFKLITINLDWMGDLITRVMVDYLEMDHCVFDVKETLAITEGRDDATLEVTQFLPPGVHCFSKINFMNTPLGVAELLVQFIFGNMGDCNVTLEISNTNYLRDLLTQRVPGWDGMDIPFIGHVGLTQSVLQAPMCRSGQAIPQILLGWHEDAKESPGIIDVTYENFNKTLKIPVAATIDNKIDIDPNRRFYPKDYLTLKVKAGLLTKESNKVQVSRTNKDELIFRSCWTVNGPHVRTFDGHYYYNLYEGHFVMWSHKVFPYEVQIVNQLCSDDLNVTCTCAASVRSGDDVFSVDGCRRKGQSPDEVFRKVTLYLIGDLSEGTRIFRQEQGLTYKVLLPHGTLVTITSTGNRLNVFIRPSAFDMHTGSVFKTTRAEGLCGNFDENKNKDLIKRNGDKYTGTGTGSKEQPSGFIEDWKVPTDEIILWGANTNHTDSELNNYCSCSHVLLMGAQCRCGHDMLVSDCDIDTAGEMPELFPMISRKSQAQLSYDRPDMVEEDVIDFDDSYTTTEYKWDRDYKDFCNETIMEDPVIEACKPLVMEIIPGIKWEDEFQLYKYACEEDAQMNNNDTEGSLSARMAARQHCYTLLDLTSLFFEAQIRRITDLDCPNDCSPHLNIGSTCANGSCICGDGYMGPDCSIKKAQSPLMSMPKFSPCDTRYQNCSYTTVYGKNFIQDKVFCHINKTKETLPTHILSTHQISCRLPDSSTGNPEVSVTTTAPGNSIKAELHADKNLSRDTRSTSADNGFEFVPYDSLCYSFAEDGIVSERTEADHCVVDRVCYDVNQTLVADECYVCNPTTDKHQLQYSTTPVCTERKLKEEADEQAARKERNLRIIFTCLLCGAVVIITVILFFVSRATKKKRAQRGEPTGPTTLGNGNIPGQTNAAYEMESPVQTKEEPYYSNIGGEDTTDGPSDTPAQTQQEPTVASSSNLEVPGHPHEDINPKEMAEFWRIKHLAAERSRQRTSSQGSRASSMGSTGIGGSGPSHYSHSRLRSSTGGSYGMGAAGPTHLGRFSRRAYSGATDEDGDPVVDSVGLGGGGAPTGHVVSNYEGLEEEAKNKPDVEDDHIYQEITKTSL